ncbi:MAG: hypothetical protein CEN91_16 [Candidatus Berkelbacteria bacterium Licking1014_85]|uniref:Uncharacterized protein n=1 Tax=Candidatus Berkelbacteria bacterium Licking1014_85 TaxID=2017148 RepID=A0A554LMS7_9BACT|nr:MAG: hypothetical protein CEN91_16 [Candidatus Berkelbacteria bacterium Licking1014_85]
MLVSVCPQFWKDLKKIKSPLASFNLPIDETGLLNDYDKLQSTKLTTSITDLILNVLNLKIIDQHSDKYSKQQFLQHGWEIRKMRFAIDNRGKSGGLRIVFCVSDNCILLVLIKHKKNCENEKELEKEIMLRIKNYISY